MCRRCFALLLALSIILSFAPLRTSVRAQAQSTDKAETQDQSGAKQNAQAAQRPAPADKQVEKVRRTVRKVGVAQRITIFLKNGDTMHGTLAQVGEDDFQLSEVDRRQTFTLRYDEVKKVREGFGGINLLTGQRSSPPRGVRIGAIVGVAVLLALPVIAIATAKD